MGQVQKTESQYSTSEISRLYIERPFKETITTRDTLTEVFREPVTFNRYVNPGSGVHFEEQCVAVHGIHPSDPRIVGADKMSVVWADFCKWVEEYTNPDDVCILVAYNGQNCDMKWLWKLTQAPFAPYRLPSKIQWFMDPYKVITSNPKCPLNHLQSKMCLRNQPKNDGYTAKERQKRCNKSMWGCAQCQEPICDVCWPKYDKHKTKVD
eukprot:scaffold20501_cov80-Cyclotella_meneghiniana.AAC.1